MWELTKEQLHDLAKEWAWKWEIPESLLMRLIEVESNWNVWAVRYEEKWQYYVTGNAYAGNWTQGTEHRLQQMSWGLMQVMGSTARMMGHKGWLTELLVPTVNLTIGCRYLQHLRTYEAIEKPWRWVITAYNHGPGWETRSRKWYREGYTARFNDILTALGEA